MTTYYIRATVGRRVLLAGEFDHETIQTAQKFATTAFLSMLNYEGFGIESLKVDILTKINAAVSDDTVVPFERKLGRVVRQKPLNTDMLYAPNCRATYHNRAVGWVWAYPPSED